jgi:methionyl-tRNA synthetase
MNNNCYFTTPIYYVNDKPHIGHAYTSIATDIMARYHRMLGKDVYFLTGTDEHGQKIAQTAKKNNTTPQELVDKFSQNFRDLANDLNLSNNDFIRTTENRHQKAVQLLWQKLLDNGQIYLDSYKGWYAVRDEAFYQENEIVDGKAPSGAEVEWVEEESYFFNLSKWQDKLLEFYAENPDFIWPQSRRNEVLSFVKSGLKDLSISRTSFDWGIKVPGNEKHIIYVWLDALTNYISALSFGQEQNKMDKYWPAIHVVGKDILRFHAVYWPAFLMAANLPLPKQIVAHGWWTNEGQKISKSLGNVIDPYQLIELYGLDQTRYYMMREIPFGNDGNYSKNNAILRLNSELANNFGNLLQRIASFVYKNCDAKIPSALTEEREVFAKIDKLIAQHHQHMTQYEFSEALEKIVQIGNIANIYVDEQAPWSLRKTDIKKMGHVLNILLNIIKKMIILLHPFMPSLTSKMSDILNFKIKNFTDLDFNLPENSEINKPEIVFKRYEI